MLHPGSVQVFSELVLFSIHLTQPFLWLVYLAVAELCALLPSQTSALKGVFVCACPSNARAEGFQHPPCLSPSCWGMATFSLDSPPAHSVGEPDGLIGGTDKPWSGPGWRHPRAAFSCPLWAAVVGWGLAPAGKKELALTQMQSRGGGGLAAEPSAAGDKGAGPGTCWHSRGVVGLVQAAPDS